MKRLFSAALLAGSLLAILPAPVKAGPFQTVPYEPKARPELYFFGYGGLNWMDDAEGITADGVFGIDLETENGWGVGGGLGLRSDWLGGTRFEVEGLHRANDVDDLLVNDVSFSTTDGEAELTGVSVNFVKELVWGSLYPYVGLGLGYGEMDVNLQSAGGGFDDSSASFLWQVLVGLDFPWTKRTSLFLEYRYMPISDFDLGFQTAIPAGVVDVNFDDVTSHSMFAGFRHAF